MLERTGWPWRGFVLSLTAVTACAGADERSHARVTLLAIGDVPTVTIGRDASSAEGILNLVADAVRLADGTIAVANGGLESRLPVFGEDGRYVRTIGRLGDGPGEFLWITSLELGAADSLLVFDASAQRLTAISTSGGVTTTPVRAIGGASGLGALRTINRLTEEVWVGQEMDFPMQGPIGVILRDTISIGLMDRTLDRFHQLERLPAAMSTTFELGDGRGFGSPAFSPLVLQTNWGKCTVAAVGDEPIVRIYSAGGQLVNSFEVPGQRRATTQEDFEAWVTDRLRLTDEAKKGQLAKSFARMAWVDEMPYYSQIVADQWGRIWMQEYSPPGGWGRRWHLVSQLGDHLADVEFPRPMIVFEINEFGVLGRTEGDFGEEYVQLFPLGQVPEQETGVLPECRRDVG